MMLKRLRGGGPEYWGSLYAAGGRLAVCASAHAVCTHSGTCACGACNMTISERCCQSITYASPLGTSLAAHLEIHAQTQRRLDRSCRLPPPSLHHHCYGL